MWSDPLAEPRRLKTDLKLVYGQAPDGVLLHIDEVSSGLSCNCKCPACARGLIAKRGKHRRHHFAHEGDAECPYAVETALHKLAKQILAQPGSVLLPELSVRNWGGTTTIPVQAKTDFHYTSAAIEYPIQGMVVDLLLNGGEFLLAVEIAVTHRCDLAKFDQFHQANLAALEIHLSCSFIPNSTAEVVERVRRGAPREWLFHPGRKAAIEKLREIEAQSSRTEPRAQRPDSLSRRREEQPAIDARLRARLQEVHATSEIRHLLPEAQTPDGREGILAREAQKQIGPQATDWLWNPAYRLGDHTPRAVARDSISGLRRALQLLKHFPPRSR